MSKDFIREFVEVLGELQAPLSQEDTDIVSQIGGDNTAAPEMADIPDDVEDERIDMEDDPDDPRNIGYIRVAAMFKDNPKGYSVPKIQAGFRRLLNGEHLSIEYRVMLNDLLQIMLEKVITDMNLYQRFRVAINGK